MTNILILEDEIITALALQMEFQAMGYKVLPPAANLEKAYTTFQENHPDIILCDIHILGEKDGIDFASLIRKESSCPIIFMTGYDDKEIRERAQKTHPMAFLIKPVSAKAIHQLIENN